MSLGIVFQTKMLVYLKDRLRYSVLDLGKIYLFPSLYSREWLLYFVMRLPIKLYRIYKILQALHIMEELVLTN